MPPDLGAVPNALDLRGSAALMHTCWGETALADLLFERGGDPVTGGAEGQSALMIAYRLPLQRAGR